VRRGKTVGLFGGETRGAKRALPRALVRAYREAANHGYERASCAPEAGWILASLASVVPKRGHILELGTGAGVGVAWIVHGLGTRHDVGVTSVDVSAEALDIARGMRLPEYVALVHGDGLRNVPDRRYDLIFADAPAGKFQGFAKTLTRVRNGGVLVMDDMASSDPGAFAGHGEALERVRSTLRRSRDFVVFEISDGRGVLVAMRRRA
jgi:predicted O-methyltransferase YrrM